MIDPTSTPNFTDGLIIGALFALWMWSEYREAQAVAEDAERMADRTSPDAVGQDFFMDSIDWKGFPNG